MFKISVQHLAVINLFFIFPTWQIFNGGEKELHPVSVWFAFSIVVVHIYIYKQPLGGSRLFIQAHQRMSTYG